MSNRKLHKRCPQCKHRRKYQVPPEGNFVTGKSWVKRDGRWICYLCVARELPHGEADMIAHREKHKDFFRKNTHTCRTLPPTR